MAYSQFDMAMAESRLGVRLELDDLFADLKPVAVPSWLSEHFVRIRNIAVLTEKARSELLVMPILVAARELSSERFAIFSGQKLDVDASLGLTGECDFLLSQQDPVPVLRAPILAIVEAKRGEIEDALGQCVAEMVGARKFNETAGHPRTIFGCVTTGEAWQFLQLEGERVRYDRTRRYRNEPGELLAVFARVAA